MYFSKTSSQRKQLGLLLWMLPWLFFCVFGDALHSHGLINPNQDVAPHAHLFGKSQNVEKPQPHHVAVSGARLATPQYCYICEWESNDDPVTQQTVTFVPHSEVVSRYAAVVAVPSSPSVSHRLAIRGPPLS